MRAAVSIVALALMFGRVDLAGVLGALAAVGTSAFAAASAAYIASQLVSAIRWMIIVRSFGLALGLSDAAKFYFIGMFFSVFAPSTLGADVARAFYVRRRGLDATTAAITVVADRVIGLVWLVVIAALALATFEDAVVPRPLARAVYAIAIAGLVSSAGGALLVRRLAIDPRRLGGTLRSLVAAFRERSLLARTSALSVVVQCCQIAAAVALVGAVAPQVDWTYCSVFQPLVAILGALPISLAGLGVREAGYVYFLATLREVPVENATAFALAWLAVVSLVSLAGAVVLVVSGEARPSPVPGSPTHSEGDQLPSSS